MYRNTLPAALLFFFAAIPSLFAQQGNYSLKLNALTAGIDARPAQRVIASTSRVFKYPDGLVVSDSVRYQYAPGFSYDFVLKDWKYKDAVHWTNKNTPVSYDEYEHIAHTYDNKNRLATEEISRYENGNWVVKNVNSYTYTPTGKIATYITTYMGLSANDSTKETYQYNAQDSLILKLTEHCTSTQPQWAPRYRDIISYNASNKRDTLIFEKWNDNTSVWEYSGMWTNDYIASTDVEYVYYFYGNGWLPNSKVHSIFDAQGHLQKQESNFKTSTGWKIFVIDAYVYDKNNLPLSCTRVQIDALTGVQRNDIRYTWEYNAQHQLVTERSERWQDTKGKFEAQSSDYENRYYYEAFTNDVPDGPIQTPALTVYPNPAHTLLNIEITGNSTATSLHLLDMNGRVVKQQQLPTAKQFNTTIDIANLPAGNYIMQLNAGGKVMTQKVTVE